MERVVAVNADTVAKEATDEAIGGAAAPAKSGGTARNIEISAADFGTAVLDSGTTFARTMGMIKVSVTA